MKLVAENTELNLGQGIRPGFRSQQDQDRGGSRESTLRMIGGTQSLSRGELG